MYRWLLAAAAMLVAQGAVAQALPSGAHVRVEQLSNSTTLQALRYDDSDNSGAPKTTEVQGTKSYTATEGDGVPANALLPIASLCALDYPNTTFCPSSQLAPAVPRFYVGKQKGTGILSSRDTATADQRRINRINADGSSAERTSITFCYTDGCNEKITGARILLDDGNGTPRVVYLYPTNDGVLVQPPSGSQTPIVANPGGINSPGIVATYSGGRSTITIALQVFANWPAFNGFQIGSGSANLQFTFRLADVAMASAAPPRSPDFVDFGCRIDLTQTSLPAQFQKVVSSTSSAKFCPAGNDGKLTLTCSRELDGYGGGTVDFVGAPIVCRISGLQCGIAGSPTAQLRKISIDQNGVATLTCEFTPS